MIRTTSRSGRFFGGGGVGGRSRSHHFRTKITDQLNLLFNVVLALLNQVSLDVKFGSFVPKRPLIEKRPVRLTPSIAAFVIIDGDGAASRGGGE